MTVKEGVYATDLLYERLKDKYSDDEVNRLYRLTKNNFKDALISSTAIPVAFEPVGIDDELFVDGGAGNNTPAKNGVDALFAFNKDMKEGLLFVVLLQPQDELPKEKLTEKNADITKVGMRTLEIVLNNTANTDVKITQKITNELERWDVVNITIQDALSKISQATVDLKDKAAAVLAIANGLTNNQQEAQKLRKIAEDISAIAGKDIEESSDELTKIIGKYRPFNGKKKVKMVIIRPQKDFGVSTLDFDEAGKRSKEIIRMGYDAALSAMYQTELISKDKFQKLMQEEPLPVGDMFKYKRVTAQKLSQVS